MPHGESVLPGKSLYHTSKHEVKPWQEITRKEPPLLSAAKVLNESATQLFCSGNQASVDEGVAIMDEVVIPCLHLMSRDLALSQEDQEAMEGVRSHWCSCLSRSMDGKRALHCVTAGAGSWWHAQVHSS